MMVAHPRLIERADCGQRQTRQRLAVRRASVGDSKHPRPVFCQICFYPPLTRGFTMSYKVFVDARKAPPGCKSTNTSPSATTSPCSKIDSDKRKDWAERQRLINELTSPFVPAGCGGKESGEPGEQPNTCVIDASTAHRVKPDWVFGLPSWPPTSATRFAPASGIANPGCHASAFILALRPAGGRRPVAGRQPDCRQPITGYSGGGRSMIAEYESPGAFLAPRAYALGLAHKHLPEMQAYTGPGAWRRFSSRLSARSTKAWR